MYFRVATISDANDKLSCWTGTQRETSRLEYYLLGADIDRVHPDLRLIKVFYALRIESFISTTRGRSLTVYGRFVIAATSYHYSNERQCRWINNLAV